MNAPLVSVIMPAYNSAQFIEEAIVSVTNQTYTNWELLVVDDASKDETCAIVEAFMKREKRIYLHRNTKNHGTGAARNAGIAAAKGRYIAFLDADDRWLPQKLEVQVKFMIEHDLPITFSSYYLVNEAGENLNKVVEALPVLTYQKLLKSNYIGNLTGIYDVQKTGKVFAPLLRKRQDWALWLTILEKFGSTKSIKTPLALYRVRKNSLSQNKAALVQYNFRIYREFLNYDLLKSYKHMSVFLYEHFFIKNRQVKDLDQGSELF